MKILLDVYLDRNIGDDMMIRAVVKKLSEHEFFLRSSDETSLLAFKDLRNLNVYSGEKIDAVVTVGGSMFELGSTKAIIKRLQTTVKELYKHRKNGKKVATIGCNLGYVNRRLAEFAVKQQLKQSQVITLRDKRSAERLKKLGIEAHYYPDMLFCTKMPRAEEKCGLVISVYRSVSRPEDNFQCYSKYAEIADKYIQKTGTPVKLLAFDCDSENDISAAYTIQSLMKYPDMTQIVVYTGDSEPVLNAISSGTCVLGTRFHSIVLALAASVPVLPVCYSDKTYGMLEDLGYNSFFLEHKKLKEANADDVVERLAHPENLLFLPPRKLEEIRYKAKGHIDSLAEFLKSGEQE